VGLVSMELSNAFPYVLETLGKHKFQIKIQ
jgi:hypothetical protein